MVGTREKASIFNLIGYLFPRKLFQKQRKRGIGLSQIPSPPHDTMKNSVKPYPFPFSWDHKK